MQIADSFTITAATSGNNRGYDARVPYGSITGTLRGYRVAALVDVNGTQLSLIVSGTNEPTLLVSISYTGVAGSVTFNGSDATIDNSSDCQLIYTWNIGGAQFVSGNTYTVSFTIDAQVNCGCTDDTGYETLGELRRRMLVRLGYAAQADNPPPGMADLLNDFLIQAQRVLYRRFKALRTERFFSWIMIPGQRFYDLGTSNNNLDGGGPLDPYEVTWAGIEDTRGIWYELIAGIPPQFYTAVAFEGYPTRYEIRQCIEVFPAPAAAYTLRMKGRFGLSTFSADDDTATIDSELVFLWALGNAKAHYSQPDANNVIAQATTYLRDLTTGAHTTKRYVPGTNPAQPWTQPKFLPLGTS